MNFCVGDRVQSIIEDSPGLQKGEYGTVTKIRKDGMLIIKWDKFCESRHDSDGSIPYGHGWFIANELLKHVPHDFGELPESHDIKFLFGEDGL